MNGGAGVHTVGGFDVVLPILNFQPNSATWCGYICGVWWLVASCCDVNSGLTCGIHVHVSPIFGRSLIPRPSHGLRSTSGMQPTPLPPDRLENKHTVILVSGILYKQ